jgi:D-sedoheptulose 7-phosphate isomerase
MKIENLITTSLDKTKQVINNSLDSKDFRNSLKKASELIVSTYNNKGKVILAGNGGSAADSQHICAEFVGRFNFDRPSLPAIALTANSSNLTCISNDYGYKNVFSRQITAHGTSDDTLIVYTTSGKSENIIELVNAARLRVKNIIAMTGNYTKLLTENCDVIISVDSDDTPKIQEVHAIAGHMICESVEHVLFGKS